jgi:hypothetical protein
MPAPSEALVLWPASLLAERVCTSAHVARSMALNVKIGGANVGFAALSGLGGYADKAR